MRPDHDGHGALKDGLRGLEGEASLFLAGGKGAASRKTPAQIRELSGLSGVDPAALVYASRISAKIDNAAVQDGYQLYHHVFAFSCERVGRALNLTAEESEDARQGCAEIARETPEKVAAEVERIRSLAMPERHQVAPADIDPKRLHRTLITTYERQPENFETLLGLEGIGPKTIRALSLVSEIVYGKPPSCRDPARFSFAHGGKDGTPFPVDREGYERTIDVMKKAIESAKVGNPARLETIRRPARYYEI